MSCIFWENLPCWHIWIKKCILNFFKLRIVLQNNTELWVHDLLFFLRDVFMINRKTHNPIIQIIYNKSHHPLQHTPHEPVNSNPKIRYSQSKDRPRKRIQFSQSKAWQAKREGQPQHKYLGKEAKSTWSLWEKELWIPLGCECN